MSEVSIQELHTAAIFDGPSSNQIDELAKALSAAQGEMQAATKDSHNPFFKSNYLSFAAVIAASRGPLAKHGLAIVQKDTWTTDKLSQRTIVLHSSGQWIDFGTLEAVVAPQGKLSPVQAAGALMSYFERYARRRVCQLPEEDNDGNDPAKQSERSEVPSEASNGPSSVASEYLPTTPEQLWKPNQVPTPATRMWILNKLQAAPGQPNWTPLADWLRTNNVISDSDTPQEWPLDLLPSTRTALEAIRSGLVKPTEKAT